MNQKSREWVKKRYADAKLAYLALMLVYPFGLEDLPDECWKWIAGYEGLYQVSNFGRVKSFAIRKGHKKGIMILKPKLTRNGYLAVCLCKNKIHKDFRIHRLVAEAFIPNPKNLPEVDHLLGNKFDCYYKNLEWVTKGENQKRAVETGLRKTGENHSRTTLTNEKVRRIRKIHKPGDTEFGTHALARKFNVSTSCINRIVHGKSYKNID